MTTPQMHEKLINLSSLTSKMLRKNFGRGPHSCHAFANGPFLVFYIRGFLSPIESVLLENGNSDNVDFSRTIVIKKLLMQLKGILEMEFGVDVKSFYHDWNYPNNTGMITIEFESDINRMDEKSLESPRDTQSIINEIDRISILVQKKPEKTEAFFISPKLYLVKRDGILIQIEKALIEKGYEHTLLVTKDELEKLYLHRNGHFEEIFSQPIADIFVDWDFNADNSMICFVLKN